VVKVSLLTPQPLALPKAAEPAAVREAHTTTFGELLKEKLLEVNRLQVEANELTNQFMAGEPIDLHTVMIAAEKANLALQLTVQIRNKLLEAYQEISRMQI